MKVKAKTARPGKTLKRMTYNVIQIAEKKSLEDLDHITDKLVEMNLRRFAIRKSTELEEAGVSQAL